MMYLQVISAVSMPFPKPREKILVSPELQKKKVF